MTQAMAFAALFRSAASSTHWTSQPSASPTRRWWSCTVRPSSPGSNPSSLPPRLPPRLVAPSPPRLLSSSPAFLLAYQWPLSSRVRLCPLLSLPMHRLTHNGPIAGDHGWQVSHRKYLFEHYSYCSLQCLCLQRCLMNAQLGEGNRWHKFTNFELAARLYQGPHCCLLRFCGTVTCGMYFNRREARVAADH